MNTNWNVKQEKTEIKKGGRIIERYVPQMIYPGGCDHHYEKLERDDRSQMTAYKCINCPNGISLDDTWDIEDGVPVKVGEDGK